MQSATPRHPRNRRNSSPDAQPDPLARADTGTLTPARRGIQRSFVMVGEAERRMRVRAGLAYAIPFVPALILLVKERRQRWLRFHAAQSLVFFILLALIQIALFAALVLFGGNVDTLPVAAVAGLVFYGLYLLVGILGLVFWLRLVADAMSGRCTRFRLLSGVAMRLEKALARLQRLSPAQRSNGRP